MSLRKGQIVGDDAANLDSWNLHEQLTNRYKTKNFSTNHAIIILMKKSLLSQTNPYLRDKAKRLSGLVVSVCSSSAIEGIAACEHPY